VCDPNKEAVGYKNWGPDYLTDAVRNSLGIPNWTPGGGNKIPGGRDNGKFIVDTYYANKRGKEKFAACRTYADPREMFEKEKDLDAVKVMTPDHLHGVLALAAMKRNKHIVMHKPVANRLLEGKRVLDLAKNSRSVTHLIAWDSNGSMDQVMKWINAGEIGTLKEIHNWTNRPVWPQYAEKPKRTPPVPKGFDWDVWLGPEADRPYHPDYTHMVFRGWYDFGGGAMADMGHYSLWSVFEALGLTTPDVIEPNRSHVCTFNGDVPYRINNDFSFPMASMVRFKYPANGQRAPVDLCWYDGGMKPPTPEELYRDNKQLGPEGMMFVGDKGKILAGFRIENPTLLAGNKTQTSTSPKIDTSGEAAQKAAKLFAEACRSGKQYPGSFAQADHLTEAVNLYAAALRSNRVLQYDAASQRITNVPDANKYLDREYRTGWDPKTI
jgi:hypothetical protein